MENVTKIKVKCHMGQGQPEAHESWYWELATHRHQIASFKATTGFREALFCHACKPCFSVARGRPPDIPIFLWWNHFNEIGFTSVVKMSFTDPRGGLKKRRVNSRQGQLGVSFLFLAWQENGAEEKGSLWPDSHFELANYFGPVVQKLGSILNKHAAHLLLSKWSWCQIEGSESWTDYD